MGSHYHTSNTSSQNIQMRSDFEITVLLFLLRFNSCINIQLVCLETAITTIMILKDISQCKFHNSEKLTLFHKSLLENQPTELCCS